ncbi:MAG: putative metal-binding motif-containing protein [Deltaproteobacteria bacterium]|nr:putative metal-binding motif-containing protein [Deltaproteobacteria bacterium]
MRQMAMRMVLAGLVWTLAGCNFFGWVGGGSGLPCQNDQNCPSSMYCADNHTCQPGAPAGDAGASDAARADAAGSDYGARDTSSADQSAADRSGVDAGTDAAGTDAAGTDAGGTDAATNDSAETDAAGTDAGGTDAATNDSAETDAAGTDAGSADSGCPDLDGDGYGAGTCAGGTDCDDTDPDVHPGAIDFPDDGVDQDCDNNFASAASANGIFIISSGADNGDCTANAPCATLAYGLYRAGALGKSDIYLTEGKYTGVTITNSVNLYGGYRSVTSLDWSMRNPAIYVSRIEEDAVQGLGAAIKVTATAQVVIDGCTLIGPQSDNQVEMSAGVTNSGNLWLRRVDVRGGRGVGNMLGVHSTGVSLRISQSRIAGGLATGVQRSGGVIVESGDLTIDRSEIHGGRSSTTTTGVSYSSGAVAVLVNNAIHGGWAIGTNAGDATAVLHRSGQLYAVHNTIFGGDAYQSAVGVDIGSRASIVDNLIEPGTVTSGLRYGIQVGATVEQASIGLVGNTFNRPSGSTAFSLHVASAPFNVTATTCQGWTSCQEIRDNQERIVDPGVAPAVMAWDVAAGRREPTPSITGMDSAVDATAYLPSQARGLRLRDIDGEPRPISGGDTGADEVTGVFVRATGCVSQGGGSPANPFCTISAALASLSFSAEGSHRIYVACSAPSYDSPLSVTYDASLFGGYGEDWTRVLPSLTSLVVANQRALYVGTGARVVMQGFALSCTGQDRCVEQVAGSELLLADSAVASGGNGSSCQTIDSTGRLFLQRVVASGSDTSSTSSALWVRPTGSAVVANSALIGGASSSMSVGAASQGTLLLVNNYLSGNGNNITALMIQGGSAVLVNNILAAGDGLAGVGCRVNQGTVMAVHNNYFWACTSCCLAMTPEFTCIQNTANLNTTDNWTTGTDVGGNLSGAADCAIPSAGYHLGTSPNSCGDNGVDPAPWYDGVLVERDIDGQPRPQGFWDIGPDEVP